MFLVDGNVRPLAWDRTLSDTPIFMDAPAYLRECVEDAATKVKGPRT